MNATMCIKCKGIACEECVKKMILRRKICINCNQLVKIEDMIKLPFMNDLASFFINNVEQKQSPKKNLELSESKISNKNDNSTNKMMGQLIYKKSKFNNLNNTIEIYKKNKTITYKLSDEEINSLEYNDAILIDKRTFCQYYFSLLLRKHIILFTFFSKNDYNLIHIKINIFFLSFSLFFALNVLFFTDKTMHKIYESKGIYHLIIQLPKIIYSSLITSVFNLIIRKFALSDKNIIDLKNIGIRKKKNEKLIKVISCLKIKFNIFFVIGFVFLCFCWYYISVFCCVYINTQIVLIKDTFLSFGFSLLYPFILNLIPGLFRIPSLKYKNSPFLYNMSKIIAQI
jgi:ribosomal 50S subunit-recycling heat shock protein